MQVDRLIFPVDFYVLDMEKGSESRDKATTQLLFGRPFMRTVRTEIDVYSGSLTMEFDRETIGFNISDTMRCPSDVHSCFSINTVDTMVSIFSDYVEKIIEVLWMTFLFLVKALMSA